jgi:tRNA (mo5U34)-methyltransferase
MGNVWFLPSCDTLQGWLRKLGFADVKCVDVTITSTGEQRSTQWMRFHSLQDFLDPNDSDKSIEGYPAPRRAIMIARAP